jgi:hypothetical protein
MSFPLLQFQAYNPMDTMIRTAMDTYGGINTGIQQRAQREYMKQQQAMLEEQQKYYGPMQEAQMGLIGAQTQSAQIEAERARAILKFMQSQLNPGANGGAQNGAMAQMPVYQNGGEQVGSMPMPQGQAQMPAMQSMAPTMQNAQPLNQQPAQQPMQQNLSASQAPGGDPYPGPSAQLQAARSMAGFPTETAQEKAAVALWQERQKKMQEMQYPTMQTISDSQNRVKGAEGVLPILDEILANPVPSQQNAGLSAVFNADNQSAYNAKIEIAKESLAASKGLSGTEGVLSGLDKVLRRQGNESLEAYEKRLKGEYNTIIDTIERLGGPLNKYQRKEIKHAIEDVKKSSVPESDLEKMAKERGFKKVDGVWMK